MRIDLHTHSSYSDGTGSPAQVITEAAAAGLDVVALTDHDTVSGWPEAQSAADAAGITLVRGMEMSASWGGRSIHLLAYLYDPDHPELVRELETVRSSRDLRIARMVELLGADYPQLTAEFVAEHIPDGATVGRPHVADALVSAGIVAERSAAFDSILRPGSPYYVRHYSPDASYAVKLIKEAGGVCVFAHPGAEKRGRIVPDAVISRLIEAGLDGLEVDHRDHTPAQRDRLRAIAQDADLIITGSSDYHGEGKPNRLGENLTAPHMLERIVAAGCLEVVGW